MFMTKIFPILFSLFLLSACKGDRSQELYHEFPGDEWPRFNKLSYEFPVEQANRMVNLVLFARFTPDFPYETLDFNMVLMTAGGEERINEYQMKVNREAGGSPANTKEDNFEVTINLKKHLNAGKPGVLTIEIESLTPRLSTTGIRGIGIRMTDASD